MYSVADLLGDKCSDAPNLRRAQGILHGIVDITNEILLELLDPIELPAAEDSPVATAPPPRVAADEDTESDGSEWDTVFEAVMAREGKVCSTKI